MNLFDFLELCSDSTMICLMAKYDGFNDYINEGLMPSQAWYLELNEDDLDTVDRIIVSDNRMYLYASK